MPDGPYLVLTDLARKQVEEVLNRHFQAYEVAQIWEGSDGNVNVALLLRTAADAMRDKTANLRNATVAGGFRS
jgi:hypothetical protein